MRRQPTDNGPSSFRTRTHAAANTGQEGESSPAPATSGSVVTGTKAAGLMARGEAVERQPIIE